MARRKKTKHPSSPRKSSNQTPAGDPVRQQMQQAHQAHKEGRLVDAARGYAEVLKQQPDHADALMLLGTIGMEREQFDDAEWMMRRALEHRPQDAKFLTNYGTLLKRRGEKEKAIQYYLEALDSDPSYVGARLNLGNTYYSLENYVDALLQFREASALEQRFEIYNGLGMVLHRIGHWDAASEAFVKALQLDPDRFEGYNNLAELFRDQGKTEASIQAYTAAARLRPDRKEVLWNRASVELASGQLKQGYSDYDVGLSSGNRKPLDLGSPVWDGNSDLADYRLGIAVEQGLGDEILFATCYPDVRERAKELLVTCDPRLAPAWQRLLPEADIVPVTKTERSQPEWKLPPNITPPDIQIPAGSLPRYFRPTFQEFANTRPILSPDPELADKWFERVKDLPEGLKVGVSWSSGMLSIRRSWSYIMPEDFAPLLQVPGATYVSLQYSATDVDLREIEKHAGVRLHSWADLDQYNDLEQVMALTDNLDLVISVNNASSRIASALGKESWLLGNRGVFSFGQSQVPFFMNTPIWSFSDYPDKAALIKDVKESLEGRTKGFV